MYFFMRPHIARSILSEFCFAMIMPTWLHITQKSIASLETMLFKKWRLPTLPLAQYHRRDKA